MRNKFLPCGILLALLAFGVSACLDDDYTPFNTDPTFEPTAPRLRVLNVNFVLPSVTVRLGGHVIAENLAHRGITAYVDVSTIAVGDSVVEVLNSEGEVLTRDTLHMRFGYNYTLTVAPAYDRIISEYKLTTSGRRRFLLKTRTDSSLLVAIADPLQPPLADRSSARWVALSIDQAQAHRWYTDPIWLYKPNFLQDAPNASSPRLEMNLPLHGFPASPGFDGMNPPRYQISVYYPFPAGTRSVYHFGYQPGMAYETGMAREFITPPYTFESGRSYTIITNGTHGELNDVSELTTDERPVPLEPIPFEVYILDDGDHSARTVRSEGVLKVSDLSANIALFHMSPQRASSWLNLAIDGAVYRPELYMRNDYPNTSVQRTGLTGEHTLGVTPFGAVWPVWATDPVTLAAGKHYPTCFYDDPAGGQRLKALEQDTTFRFKTLRVRIGHFSSDLETIRIVNLRTGEVVVPSLAFEEVSGYFELPITSSPPPDPWTPGSKSVDRLQVQNAATGEILFELPLSQINPFTGVEGLPVDPAPSSDAGMMNYTVFLNGKFHDPLVAARRNVWGAVRINAYTTEDTGSGTYYEYATF